MEDSFKVLADSTCRLLLDRYRDRNGQTLGQPCAALPDMTRMGRDASR